MASKRVAAYANYSVTPLSANSRLVSSHEGPRWLILVSYKTPVAAYSMDEDNLFVTSKPWSPTTRMHQLDFGRTVRPGTTTMGVDQPWFDVLLKEITGQAELAE